MTTTQKNEPRPEYPRPQMTRDEWMNLNGDWEFEIDNGRTGRERNILNKERFNQTIVVPFCPESKLSGVENKDFMSAVWYRRTFTVPKEWEAKKLVIHFGAVDYDTEVWVNGVSVGTHRGGYSSFAFDITDQVQPGENVVTVCAEDDNRTRLQPRGKQSSLYYSHACDYTRTTGIWQTVWLECVNETYVSSLKYYPDPDNACVHVDMKLTGHLTDATEVQIQVVYKGNPVGEVTATVGTHSVRIPVPLSEVHLWEVGKPKLYDVQLTVFQSGSVVDEVKSYFGLRTVTLSGKAILINGKPVFQRLVLDQGFYPDGIYTAPTDDALRRDIELSLELGFNGARLHEKMFEERYLYWADKLGYIVWGEHANWGLDISTATGLERFLPEWMEGVERDFNHPAIIGWCPFNETWDNMSANNAQQNNEVLRIVYEVTKQLDSTRPVIDTSGNFHVVTDIFDIHDYEQDPDVFAAKFEPMKHGGEAYNTFPLRQKYQGQPYFVSEYGGIWWNPNQVDGSGWGYGNRPKSEHEFIRRYEGLTTALLDNPNICAFCYTQLYDVEQEVNGLYTYDRKPKFDTETIRKINTKEAAIEGKYSVAAIASTDLTHQ
ncbi:glycoside hydrolase family 2 protein [Alicyclobacillus ferrooxydans]|uniref:Beta-galactosidase n=1 Tax=Alicyclobacillus ferrooxydans TaxID=471514 RepID=A0A0P9CLU4_9BACL|nr:sugar-binding domain-containing protein [Alicyclobacillus ferrooxydans]KPV43959.1 beta-galactosidase [Alicyclobacillus ferrooxydans]